MRANQKLGSAWPNTEIVRASRSIQELGRSAAMTPSGMAMTRAKPRAQTPRVIVTGNRAPIIEETGSLKKNEVPKSPRSALPAQSRYCAASG